jgi:hypothetical protein
VPQAHPSRTAVSLSRVQREQRQRKRGGDGRVSSRRPAIVEHSYLLAVVERRKGYRSVNCGHARRAPHHRGTEYLRSR